MLLSYKSINRSSAAPVATARSRHSTDVTRGCDMWCGVTLRLFVLANVSVQGQQAEDTSARYSLCRKL